ncbi:MAG: exodeoxyribonuclease III [Opitutaceae bacterium]
MKRKTAKGRVERLRLLSWNVNGIRAVLKKGFLDSLAAEAPDVLCLQEVKARPDQVDSLFLPAGYRQYWNPADRAGYAGTAILTRREPLAVTLGMGEPEHDREGRVMTAEFADFFLVNCYTPNSQRELTRLDYRQTWDRLFREYLLRLEASKPVVFCGDLNVAHREIDLARPKENRGNSGFTDEERAGFDALLKAGFVDTFRAQETSGGHYSWWTYRAGAREKNIGWRIDYWCVSKSLIQKVDRSWILPHVMGSDHCPVGLEIDL